MKHNKWQILRQLLCILLTLRSMDGSRWNVQCFFITLALEIHESPPCNDIKKSRMHSNIVSESIDDADIGRERARERERCNWDGGGWHLQGYIAAELFAVVDFGLRGQWSRQNKNGLECDCQWPTLVSPPSLS